MGRHGHGWPFTGTWLWQTYESLFWESRQSVTAGLNSVGLYGIRSAGSRKSLNTALHVLVLSFALLGPRFPLVVVC